MGGFLSGFLGTNNDYNAGRDASVPYNPNQVGQQWANITNLQTALQDQMAGKGPNPSQDQYMQEVDQNNAQAASTMASARGVNPALAAKMAIQQQAGNNQAAARQAAILRAQQQLAAQKQLGDTILGQEGVQNQANLGTEAINANVASGNQQMAGSLVGGALQGIGQAAQSMSSAFGMAKGGVVPSKAPPVKMAEGGSVGLGYKDMAKSVANPYAGLVASAAGLSPAVTGAGVAPDAYGAKAVMGGATAALTMNYGDTGSQGLGSDLSASGGPMGGEMTGMPDAQGGMDGGSGSGPGMAFAAKGGMMTTSVGSKLKSGGKVPGQAKVPGDSLKNDTVKAQLSPGEIVLPRSVTQSKNPGEKAKRFVEAVMAKKGFAGSLSR